MRDPENKKIFGMSPEFFSIFSIGLFYFNPTLTDSYLKKSDKYGDRDLSKKIFFKTYILNTLPLFILYGIWGFAFDLLSFPLLLDIIIISTIFFASSQAFIYYFNIFYESNDTEILMTLPVKESTVFKAKMLLCVLLTFQVTSALLVILLIYECKALGIIPGLVIGLLLYGAFLISISALGILGISFVSKSKLLSRHRNTFLSIVSIVSSLIFIGIFYGMNFLNRPSTYKSFPFLKIIRNNGGLIAPYLKSLKGSIIILIIISTIATFLVFLCLKKLSKGYYSFILSLDKGNNQTETTNKIKRNLSLKALLQTYNSSLVLEDTMFSQLVFSMLFFSIYFVVMFIFQLNKISIAGAVPVISLSLLIGFVLGSINYFFNGNPSSMAFSIERESHYYLKVLPINKKDYLLSKIGFLVKKGAFLNIIFIPTITFALKLPAYSIIIALVPYFVANCCGIMYWMNYDINNLDTTWNSIGSLAQRSSKVVQFLLLLPLMIMISAIGPLYQFLYNMNNTIVLTYIFIIILILISILSISLYKKLIRKL